MFHPRRIKSSSGWLDGSGTKIYTISASGKEVPHSDFLPHLSGVKAAKSIEWSSTPSFTIFHEGSSARYLVLAWWGNDNELFTSVSVLIDGAWVEDPSKYSFCLWDLEIFWAERNIFVSTMYSGHPDIYKYRQQRLVQAES